MLPPAWLHCPAAASRRVRQGVGTSCQPSSYGFQPCLFIHHFESQNQGLDAEEGQSRGEGACGATLSGGLGPALLHRARIQLPHGTGAQPTPGREGPRSILPSSPEGVAKEPGKGTFSPVSPEVPVQGAWSIPHASVPAR